MASERDEERGSPIAADQSAGVRGERSSGAGLAPYVPTPEIVRDPQRLAALRREALLDSAPEASFDRLTRLASKLLHAPVSLISLVDEHRQFFKSSYGLAEPWATKRETPLEYSFCQFALTSDQPFAVNNAPEHPLVRESPAIDELGARAYLGIPLITREGHALGAFCVLDATPRTWTPDEIETLQDLAASVMAEIELRAAVRQAEHEAARARTSTAQIQAMLDVLPVGVVLADATGQMTQVNAAERAIWGEPFPQPGNAADYATFKGWHAKTGEPMTAEDWGMVRAVKHGESFAGDEIEIETFTGERKTVLNFGAPVRDDAGAIIGGIVAILDITARKRMERERAHLLEREQAARREAEARAAELEAAFEALADGVVIYDQAGRTLRGNAAFRDLLQRLIDPERQGLPLPQRTERAPVLDPEGNPVPLEQWPQMRVLRGEALRDDQAHDIAIRALDGSLLRLSVSGTPLRDGDGQLTGAVCVYRDVTVRRELEQRLAEQARETARRATELETMLEAMADGVVVYAPDGGMLRSNSTFRAMLALDRLPDYTQRSLEDRLALMDLCDLQGKPLAREQWPMLRVLRGEALTGANTVDMWVRALDGRDVLLSMSGAPLRDANGAIAGGVTVYRDVTERRQLEQRTKEALDALLALAETLVYRPEIEGDAQAQMHAAGVRVAKLMRNLLACSRASIATIDGKTGNLQPVAVVGIPPEQEAHWFDEVPKRRLSDYLSADLIARMRAGEAVVADLAEAPGGSDTEIFNAHPILEAPMLVGEHLIGVLSCDFDNATHHTFTERELALAGAAAKLAGLVIERERLLRERSAAQAQALAFQESNRRMDEFMSIASHELRTPLTSMKANIQLASRRIERLIAELEHQENADASRLLPVQQMLARAGHQADMQNRLVGDLLDVSRIQTGKMTFRLAACDLNALVHEITEEQRLAHPARKIGLDAPTDALIVNADADRIGQVLTNFLTNALKYSPEHAPVEVTLRQDGKEAYVAVRDEGPGLPPEEQERIWERFHRAPGVEVQSGSGVGLGLGLYICKTIVQQHGGRYGVHSAPGAGSTFWFTVPLCDGEQMSEFDQPR